MKERIKGRRNFPTEEVDPDHFYTDEEVKKLIQNRKNFKFQQKDYLKLYNCVHCGECETELERIELKEKFLLDGNDVEGLN